MSAKPPEEPMNESYYVVCLARSKEPLQVVGPFPTSDAANSFALYEASRAYGYTVVPGITANDYVKPAVT